jgi:hypothetical protein
MNAGLTGLEPHDPVARQENSLLAGRARLLGRQSGREAGAGPKPTGQGDGSMVADRSEDSADAHPNRVGYLAPLTHREEPGGANEWGNARSGTDGFLKLFSFYFNFSFLFLPHLPHSPGTTP